MEDLTGGNAEAVPNRKAEKRKLVEDITSDEVKKVKLMALATEPPSQNSAYNSGSGPPTSGTSPPGTPPRSGSDSLSAPSSQATGQCQVNNSNHKKKSLLDMLLAGGKVDVGKGFGLFD
jgi:hypothetical protein